MAGRLQASDQRSHQARLADPRLAGQQHGLGPPCRTAAQRSSRKASSVTRLTSVPAGPPSAPGTAVTRRSLSIRRTSMVSPMPASSCVPSEVELNEPRSRRCVASLTTIELGAARICKRAATLGALPTAQSSLRRLSTPISPATTSPVCTAMRTCSGRGRGSATRVRGCQRPALFRAPRVRPGRHRPRSRSGSRNRPRCRRPCNRQQCRGSGRERPRSAGDRRRARRACPPGPAGR